MISSQILKKYESELPEEIFRDPDNKRYLLNDPNPPDNFPVNALPKPVKELVISGSEALGVPNDFIAIPALTALAAAIGNSRCIEIKNTWSEKAIIYAVIVCNAGSGKTPAQDLAMGPIYGMQKQLQKSYQLEIEEHQADLQEWERAKKVKCNVGSKPEQPIMAEIFCDNATVESLAVLMDQNPRGIIMIQDELTAWVKNMDAYRGGKGADKEFFLSSWSSRTVKVNRISRETIIINNPYISIIGAMTPSGMQHIIKDNNDENGFMDRLLFSFPESPPMQKWMSADIDEATIRNYHRLWKRLWEMQPNDEEGHPYPVLMNKDAEQVFIDYYEKLAVEAGDNKRLISIYSKLRAYVARFALILHLCEKPEMGHYIDGQTMNRATLIIDYFKEHVKRIYSFMDRTEDDKLVEKATKWMRRWIEDEKKRTFTQRDFQRGMNLESSKEAKKFAAVLEDRGITRIVDSKTVAGNLSVTYLIEIL